jgi:hypothetical protein
VLRRHWILVGVALILGAALLVELYLDTRYPETAIEIALPEFQVGEVHMYSFHREGQLVGSHSYAVTDREGAGASARYTMASTTNVTHEGSNFLLQGEYVFYDNYRPLSYQLNVTQGDRQNRIKASFTQDRVELTVHSDDDAAQLTEQITAETLLIENQMPGYWEILFQSTTLTPGKRYVAHAFIPQRGSSTKLTLTVDGDTSKVRREGVDLECTVVREANMGLEFYIYGGELIQYRDDANGVVMTKDG